MILLPTGNCFDTYRNRFLESSPVQRVEAMSLVGPTVSLYPEKKLVISVQH
jgi:hypothetical protein